MLYLDVLNRRNAFSGNLNAKGQTTWSKFRSVLIHAHIFFTYMYILHRKIPSINLRLEDIKEHILALKCEIWSFRDGNMKHKIFRTWRLIWYVGNKPPKNEFPSISIHKIAVFHWWFRQQFCPNP
jgi:hypothetical protein